VSRKLSGGAQRLVTAAVGVPLILLAVFHLPPIFFFLLMTALFGWAVLEYVRLLRPQAERAPLRALLGLYPPVAFALWQAFFSTKPQMVQEWLLAIGLFLTVGVGSLLLFSHTPHEKVPAALGIVGFGIPYFALPTASLVILQAVDPWLVVLLMAIVWIGDSAAYYVGSSIGRHKMAPRVSPKKTWEGAAASLLAGLLATVAWSLIHLERVHLGILAVAAVTGVAAQLGDLFESMLKRGVNTKDSGTVLPGHGGVLDRVDALLWAAPVLVAGLWVLRLGGLHP
jgi:phosphatidate cytidylyltransferase